MWSVTIAHHDGVLEQHTQGDAAWRRLFSHDSSIFEIESSPDLLFISLRRPGVRVVMKRDAASTTGMVMRPGRFYQILNKNAIDIDGSVYLFSEKAVTRAQNVEEKDQADVQATVPYDMNEPVNDDEDNMETQLYDAPEKRNLASMEETQPYFVDEPAARRVSIDATQLYDVRAAPDATQLYDEGAETRANPNETQLYDQVSIVTRVHVEETQLYDQTNVVTRKAYAEETQLYDQHIVTTVREATQLYDQGARDEEETQLYDAHADIRPPPRGGSIVAEQTQLYDQKEDNERERAELARKRRREEEDAEAMETMIYDEDMPDAPPPGPPSGATPRSPVKPVARTPVRRMLEAEEKNEEDEEANDMFDAIAKRALGVPTLQSVPSFTLHVPNNVPESSDAKSDKLKTPQNPPFQIPSAQLSPMKKRLRDEIDKDEDEANQHTPQKARTKKEEGPEISEDIALSPPRKRPRRGDPVEKEKEAENEKPAETEKEMEQEREKEEVKGKGKVRGGKAKAKTQEKEKEEKEEVRENETDKELETTGDNSLRRSRRTLKPSALIMESQMGADLDFLPEMYRDAKKRVKEGKPSQHESEETEELKFAKVNAEAEREVLLRRNSTKSTASQEEKRGRKRSASTAKESDHEATTTPAKGHIRPPSPPPMPTPRARPPDVPPFPSGVAIVFSGFEPADATELGKMAVDLGARVVNEVQDATHLVTCLPFKRTMKLLSAIVHLRPIIDVAWLRDSHKSKSKNLLSFEKYALKDRKVEREFGFTLAETQRLWEEKRNVFEGKSFYVTRRTRPSPSDLKTLITAGGGKVLGTVVAARAERPRESCFVISCEEDADEFAPLLADGLRVCSSELILRSVLQHRFDPDDESVALEISSKKSTPARGKK